MEPRVNYALVGLFVLVLTGVFLVTTLWLVGVGPTADYRTYAVYPPESVAGITAESLVKFQGVDVGKVREAGIVTDSERGSTTDSEPGNAAGSSAGIGGGEGAGDGARPRVRLLIDVRREVTIRADTTARLATQGLTGLLYFIELRGGEGTSPPLEAAPGAPYPVIQAELSDLARLQQSGTELLEEAKGAATELRQTLASLRTLFGEDDRGHLRTTLGDASTATAGLAQATGTLNDYLERLGPALDDLTRTIATLPGLSDRAGVTLEAAATAASSVGEAARRLDKLAGEAAPLLKTLNRDGLPELTALLNDLRGLTGRLDRLAEDLARDPNLLLQGRPRRPGPGER
ncbi:MAG: MCE family protein [Gammaproteobacteria bacterium]|jgi:phospholipid/cholesterol/gamma-HCH transport system substrate-binding protein|nr:MCE family protein [Gammaproteobacteria bacterium]